VSLSRSSGGVLSRSAFRRNSGPAPSEPYACPPAFDGFRAGEDAGTLEVDISPCPAACLGDSRSAPFHEGKQEPAFGLHSFEEGENVLGLGRSDFGLVAFG
jgi:hypothetical protein